VRSGRREHFSALPLQRAEMVEARARLISGSAIATTFRAAPHADQGPTGADGGLNPDGG
jgi:hypothetical protein